MRTPSRPPPQRPAAPDLNFLPKVEAVGAAKVRTLESLGTESAPHPLQRAFVEGQAGQCGYCLPGIIMRAAAFLRDHPAPSRAEVSEALDPNLCRCGSQQRIVNAVLQAATEMVP